MLLFYVIPVRVQVYHFVSSDRFCARLLAWYTGACFGSGPRSRRCFCASPPPLPPRPLLLTWEHLGYTRYNAAAAPESMGKSYDRPSNVKKKRTTARECHPLACCSFIALCLAIVLDKQGQHSTRMPSIGWRALLVQQFHYFYDLAFYFRERSVISAADVK